MESMEDSLEALVQIAEEQNGELSTISFNTFNLESKLDEIKVLLTGILDKLNES